ncbi:DEAD/DEAH box helicase [Pseudoclavibacter sp. AY1F1]|uniref:helicase C-terminal domain-containing protein n=1 Tax=Pseudoclavibacter sp. AY1F1 TaxID=2080583 RepID=UPI000CE85106|nr:helicase C-terminal domain-containing protein [Pseudoclavibacter sp. AY1F1]PPF45984.1 DEAD/DEAH box helicase [Pseudoclavibacter sp. AY1F1]
MPIDLSNLGRRRGAVSTQPRDIFDALPSRPWPRLRLEQGEVLKLWHERRAQRDIVIKQNTGGGKTVAGLLIAQSSLNEAVGPAVYLAPDTYLASQALHEGERLGLSVTDNARSADFRAGRSILVTTFQKVVNGQSVFGVVGGSRSVTNIGTIVVDDAHSALAITEKQFKVSVPASSPVYDAMFRLFNDSLRDQGEAAWKGVREGQVGATIRVPFWSWNGQQLAVRNILDAAYSEADGQASSWLYYSWPLVSQVLHLCAATVTGREFEIRPPCSPIELIPAFANARRRVYLTATLSDDSVLVTDFGANPKDIERPVTPERASDLGDRLILAPLSINPSVVEDSVRALVKDFSVGAWGDGEGVSRPVNVVVLVPSDKRAKLWSAYADRVCYVEDLPDLVAQLKSGEQLGVTVLVNKYDGVDLPGEACRLLVVDGVPFPLSPSESRMAAALRGTETYAARQTQKIEQGMGRGVRDAEDYCAVLLLGSELALSLTSPHMREHYSAATRIQIDLSLDLADMIKNEGLEHVRQALGVFLRREPAWLEASRGATAGVEYDQVSVVHEVERARRRAFDLARAGQFYEATQVVLDGARALTPLEQGWYHEEAAAYAAHFDSNRSQEILRNARLNNIHALLPVTAVPIAKLRPSARQAQALHGYLSATYANSVELELGFASVLDSIVFDAEQVEAAEQAFMDLGLHLGFAADRPDKRYGTGPDVVWALPDDQALVIELKSGVTRHDARIIKSEVDQVAGHLNWCAENFGEEITLRPVLVHPSASHMPNATPPSGLRMLTPDAVENLKDRVKSFSRAAAADENWLSVDKLRELLAQHGLTGHSSIANSALVAQMSEGFVANILRNESDAG